MLWKRSFYVRFLIASYGLYQIARYSCNFTKDNLIKYDLNTEYNYNSENKLSKVTDDLKLSQVKVAGVYQKIIEYAPAFSIDDKVRDEICSDAVKIAKEVGIKAVKSEMLPQDKYNELDTIIAKRDEHQKVAFVGDGINDSPVLARADVGISMGGVGSESAIEASDVVIMTDNVSKILNAIKISKKTCGIIRQNLVFAVTVKVLILFLSTIGLSGMWQAVFADVGVTIICVLNSLRLMNLKNKAK